MPFMLFAIGMAQSHNVLILVTLLASYVPAHHATKVDPSAPFPSRPPPPALPFSGDRWHFECSQITCFQHLRRLYQ